MGTKVQCKSYLPGYHPARNLIKDTNFSWNPFCEDKALNDQLCNNFKSRGVSSWPDYDKETLKQTMIEHEAIFQKQDRRMYFSKILVYELHRLYRIQKELMHQLRNKQPNRSSGPAETSKSSMFLSQMPPEFGEKMWHLPHPSRANTSNTTANVRDNDDDRVSNFLKEGATQCSSTKNGGNFKDDGPHTKFKTIPKRMFDLDLPADAYIENEDIERAEGENVSEPCIMAAETLKRISGIKADNNVKLTLGNVEIPVSGKGISKSDLHPRNGLSIHRLADLNEPFKDSCEEGAISLGSYKSSGLNSDVEELQQPWNLTRSKNKSPQRNLFMDKHINEVSMNYLDTDKVERGHQWLLSHSDSGQSKIVVNSIDSGLFSEKYPMSSESIKLKLDKARETLLPDQNQTEMWFGEKTTHSTETFGCQDYVTSNYPGCTSSQVSSALSLVSPFPCATSASALTPWRMPSKSVNQIPITVQAFPCFTGSSTLNGEGKNYNAAKQSNRPVCDKIEFNGDLQPHKRLDYKSSSPVNGHHHGIQMCSTSTGIHCSPCNLEKPNLDASCNASPYKNSKIHEPLKCSRDLQFIDINSVKDLNLNQGILGGIQDGFTNRQFFARKHDESSNDVIWLREKPSCKGSAECDIFVKDYAYPSKFLAEKVKDKGSSVCPLRHSLSSFDIKESRTYRAISTDILNVKGNFSPPDNSHRIFDCSNSVTCDGQLFVNDLKRHAKGKAIRNPGLRNDINLNSDLMPADGVRLFGMTAEDERQTPSSLSLARVADKLTSKIDLEAPTDEMEEANNFSRVEIVDMNCPVTQVERKQEKTSYGDTCVRLAADTIVSMSVDVHDHTQPLCSFAPSFDSLYLLAEVVKSNAEIEASDDDGGLDAFESLTMKLEELKPDEYYCKPCQQEKPKDDEKSMASLLLPRPRRGQARKRRQRRDFQRDILPALVSLSRHEVTEDLQALGGMIRAGKSRQTGSTRSTSQNMPSSRSRGRGRPRSLAITIAEVCDDSPPQLQPTRTDLENDGKNIMAWGRTTRRCHRQRIPLAAWVFHSVEGVELMATTVKTREFDVVILGGSGFTGKYVIREALKFLSSASGPLRSLALAGRSPSKLAAALQWAAAASPPPPLSIISADVFDPTSLLALCRRTRIILNCVGPFHLYGDPVVAACVEAGTDYLDITGEPEFIERTETRYHERAEKAGSLVVSACGFDSVVAELGLMFHSRQWVPPAVPNRVEAYLSVESERSIALNIGTYESMVVGMANVGRLPDLRRSRPKSARPVIAGPPPAKGPLIEHNKTLGLWAINLPSVDAAVVRRTHEMLAEHPHGLAGISESDECAEKRKLYWSTVKPVHFGVKICAKSILGILRLMVTGLFLGLFGMFALGRSILLKFPSVFSLGWFRKTGPTEEEVRSASFIMWFIGHGYSDANLASQRGRKPDTEVITRVSGPEAGYVTTPIILLQCALVVLSERDNLPKGGVLPSGIVFSHTNLQRRLEENGIFFDVISVKPSSLH
ncbi:hypothetical protein MUK42_14378 [Musa troglodytarum]|uniref:Saccharopine dehydrogenase NADP binding domain-containing protein n=1 Tax=Musa troglodytarum TaxID=320322 RepID=A0A9E7I8C0_9LILI|nr:hypothetical protein MUK42_14378 [Musa troglodytarum]URE48160.1 hypothetical protein MUK42_14378 [Musa troglodytarum]